jgi:hypothetical protein
MTRPNRNEIERMLAAGEAPKPPDGLLERLHADIPEDLSTTAAEERREVSFWRQGWLAAASLIAVVGMGYVMMRVVDSPEFQNEMVVAERAPMAASSPADAPSGLDADAAGNAVAETVAPPFAAGTLKDSVMTQAAAAEGRGRPEQIPTAPAVGVELQAAARDDRDESYREPIEVTASAPVAMAPPPPPAAAAVGGQTGAFAQEVESDSLQEARAERSVGAPRPTPSITSRSQMQKSADQAAPSRATSSGALVDTEADPVSTFGLRVADSSWTLVSRALEGGRLPDPQSVRPEELINHFRYSDPEPGRGEVTVRTEGAESPLRVDGSEHLLRVGIRVSSNDDLAVRGAKMQVEFDPASVDAYRLYGYEQNRSRSSALPQGDDLAPGLRVTALYDVRIGTQVGSSANLGTVSLQYENRQGEKKKVEQVIRKSDLGLSWSDASGDLQLAALVGDWAAFLQQPGSKAEAAALERRAAAVSAKWRGDARVAELAELIGMTAKLIR